MGLTHAAANEANKLIPIRTRSYLTQVGANRAALPTRQLGLSPVRRRKPADRLTWQASGVSNDNRTAGSRRRTGALYAATWATYIPIGGKLETLRLACLDIGYFLVIYLYIACTPLTLSTI